MTNARHSTVPPTTADSGGQLPYFARVDELLVAAHFDALNALLPEVELSRLNASSS